MQTPQNPLQFRQWLVTQIDRLTEWSEPGVDVPEGAEFALVNEEPLGPDLNIFEDAGDIVREAGEIALRFGLPELYRECYVPATALAIRTAKEMLGRCLAACNKLPATTIVREPPKGPKGLSYVYERALRQYERVVEVLGPKITDEQGYQWLGSHMEPGDPQMPVLDTWLRYLRAARKFYGVQKNSPRAGRTGRSIVSVHDIEPRWGGDDD